MLGFHRRQWLLLLLVTTVAAALRFLHLGEWSLWIDEAHTWRDATMPLHAYLREDRVLYPLTFLLLRLLLDLHWLDGAEGWLRLPFALVGIVSVPVLALCGRSLVGAPAALLAAALCAINPWHIYWSQNARGYILVFLCSTIAVHRAHAWLGSSRSRDLLTAMGAISLAALCHPTGGMLAVGLVAYLWLRRYPTLGSRAALHIMIAVVVLVLVLPWFVEQLPFTDFLRSKAETSLMHFVQTTGYYFRPLALLLGAVGLWLAPSSLGRDRTRLLGCCLLVPFLVMLVIGGQLAKVTARYAFCALPILLWLGALACTRVAAAIAAQAAIGRVARVAAMALLPVLLAVDFGELDLRYYGEQRGQRAQWRRACESANELAAGRAIRVLTVSHPTVLYYLSPDFWSTGLANPKPDIQVLPLIHWMIRDGADETQKKVHEPGAENHLRWHLDEAAKQKALFVVMITLPEFQEQDQDGSMSRLLQRDFELVQHWPCWVGPKDESIYVYVPRSR